MRTECAKANPELEITINLSVPQAMLVFSALRSYREKLHGNRHQDFNDIGGTIRDSICLEKPQCFEACFGYPPEQHKPLIKH